MANILENTPLWWAYVAGGVALSIPFFKFFFLGISEKHIKRMLGVKSPASLPLFLFDIKGYFIMMFMISLGIFFPKNKGHSGLLSWDVLHLPGSGAPFLRP